VGGDDRVSAATLFAQIEPTTRCNYTCGFCVGRKMRQGDLSWDTFEKFLKLHPGLKHVELQGEGEPLLHPRFFDMVEACRARGAEVSLITNGSMLSINADRLVASGVASVHVSLESAEPDEFAKIRGGRLAKVIEGLQCLMQRRRDGHRKQPTVGFCVTILRSTLGAIHEIVALYERLDLDGGISVQLLQDMDAYADHYDDAMRGELVPREVWRDYRWVVEAARGKAFVRPYATSYYGALFEGFDPATGTCPWLERGTYMTIDGTVAGCCYMKNPEHAFGNLRHGDAPAIEEKRRGLARELKNGRIPVPCAGCDVANAIIRAMC
jgi:MoaA/NifB/PqqE/SkfB family radical SAM enzyme